VQKVLRTTFLLYVQNLYNCVSRILAWYNLKTLHLLPFRAHSILRSVKDSLGLNAPGVYKMCECRAIYIGEAGCMIDECIEHQRDLWPYHLECLAVTEHSVNHGYRIYFEDTTELAKLPHYTSRVIQEAIDINLHNNFNKEGGYQLSCLEDDRVYGQAAERLPQTYVPINPVPKLHNPPPPQGTPPYLWPLSRLISI
jgi:hypothetical protein